MNKSLIETLAEQATVAVESRPGTGICEMPKYNLKFAELIVKECVKLSYSTSEEEVYISEGFDAGRRSGAAAVGNKINRHFGISQ
jgi:hypothetical protein